MQESDDEYIHLDDDDVESIIDWAFGVSYAIVLMAHETNTDDPEVIAKRLSSINSMAAQMVEDMPPLLAEHGITNANILYEQVIDEQVEEFREELDQLDTKDEE